jgi:hypothetical protein
MVPLWLDAGYRLSRQFYVGAYFQWAPAFVSDDSCPKNLSCSAYDLRGGANVQWHFKWIIAEGTWAGAFDPWVGLGVGYESAIVHLESVASGARSLQSYYGPEYGNLQLGADYVGGAIHVGAFGSLSLTQFLGTTQTNPSGSFAYSIPDPRLHMWISVGLRGQYDL